MYILHKGKYSKILKMERAGIQYNWHKAALFCKAIQIPACSNEKFVGARLANCLMERCGRWSRRMPESLTGRAAFATATANVCQQGSTQLCQHLTLDNISGFGLHDSDAHTRQDRLLKPHS